MWRRVLHYGSFWGRASRAEYGWALATYAGSAALLLTIGPLHVYSPGGLMIVGLNYIALFVWIAASVRHMHDLGKSGWLLLWWPIASFVLLAWCVARPSRA